MTRTLPTPLRRRLAAATAAGLLALGLAACGGEDGSDETADDENSSQASDETSPDESASASSGSPSAEESSDAPAAALPEWAPEIVTDADGGVTALDFTDTPEPTGELQIATVTEGDGPPVEVGQQLTVDYFGSIYQGEQQFDDSYSRGEPAMFPIGVGSLIQGWDQGIPGVPVGSRIIMMIPPDLGYGDQEAPGIPPGSTLYFVIDVIDAA